MTSESTVISGMTFHAPITPEFQTILTPEAVSFVKELVEEFSPSLKLLLDTREKRQRDFDDGKLPDFLPETIDIRQSNWQVGAIPADLQDRTVEITGPVDRKMIINALNSPVKVFMADFEDSQCPSWEGVIEGQINLRDAVNRSISFTNDAGKEYKLNDKTAVLITRVRGLHLPEKHITYDEDPIPGCLLDFGLYFYHNLQALLSQGKGPYFYLPKLESHLEARWWNDVFNFSQDKLQIPRGKIKATVLIETIPAVFEMDEILFELKDHIVGLNCGRWDYIFSFIKTFRNHASKVLPDRHQVTMDKHFLDAYSKLLVQTCHKRGAFAMGGMSAFIPVKDDAAANKQAFDQVRTDKEREVNNGHDGTWIAHPGLAPIAIEAFEQRMDGHNQLDKKLEGINITAADLLEVPQGRITDQGLRNNIRVAVQYIEAWISGNGCVPLYNLMEDAATAEISRTQIWQWIKQPNGVLEDGREITVELFRTTLQEELNVIRAEVGEERFAGGRFEDASKIMDEITTSDECISFLTLKAYDYLD